MLKFRSPVVLQLRDGDLLPLAGVRLVVESGRVWLTQAGDPADHVVGSGESVEIAPGALALVGAEGPVRLALASQSAGWSGRLHATWRRVSTRWARRLPCDLDFSLAK
jgi:hypothetical protein